MIFVNSYNLNDETYQKCQFYTRRYSINVFRGFIQKIRYTFLFGDFCFFFLKFINLSRKQNILFISNMPSSSKIKNELLQIQNHPPIKSKILEILVKV